MCFLTNFLVLNYLIFQIVREKFNKHKRAIELLSAGGEEIERALPCGGNSSEVGNSSAAENLKRFMEEVSFHPFLKDFFHKIITSIFLYFYYFFFLG